MRPRPPGHPGRLRHRAADETGLTLVEMTVVVFVLGIVLATAMTFMSTAIIRGTEASEQTQLQNDARQVLDQLVRELRQANSGAPTSVPAIETFTASTITFLAPNSATPYAMRRISYTIAGGELRRAEVTSTDTDGYPWVIAALPAYTKVLGSVQNTAAFTYLDDTGATATTAAAIQTVRVSVDIDPFPTSGSAPQTYTVSVHPRSVT